MKKINKVLILLLVFSVFFTSCSKKEDVELNELEEETESNLDEIKEEEIKSIDLEEEEVESEQEDDLARSVLSGVETTEELAELPIVGIMLDNHPDARWQAGLRDAEIVYEIRVEGNFTRYLALFQITDPQAIGPIRSARTPFINRILEYDAIYLHYGAASEVMTDIANLGLYNVNGMVVGMPVYYRNHDVGKVAPHNAYSSMAGIREYTDNTAFPEKTEFSGYDFYLESTAPGGKKAEDITLHIMSGNQTAYSYIADKGIYHRYKDGELHLDENDGNPLEVTNIIVQFADGVLAANGVHTDIKDIGEGKALLFTQGEVNDITWEKSDRSSPTKFFDTQGEPMKLNIGQTFIQVVDQDITIDID